MADALGSAKLTSTAVPSQLREHLQRHYSEGFFEEDEPAAKGAPVDLDDGDERISVEKLVAAGEQVSTIRVVNTVIADAVRRGASDLHLEPNPRGIRVRYRIDGQMCPILTLPSELLPSVVAR